MQYRKIPLDKIIPNIKNPRKEKRNFKLKESMKKIGLLEPILVYPEKNKYRIFAGDSRYWVAKELGWKSIDCMIDKNKDTFLKTMAENLIRKKLNLFEEADGIDYLLKEKYGKGYLTILASPENPEEKKAIIGDLTTIGVSVQRANDLISLLVISPDLKKKILAKNLPLKYVIKLINVRDVEKQEKFAEMLGSPDKQDRNRAFQEMAAKKEESLGGKAQSLLLITASFKEAVKEVSEVGYRLGNQIDSMFSGDRIIVKQTIEKLRKASDTLSVNKEKIDKLIEQLEKESNGG